MDQRKASIAIIGAGDFIGAGIARRFAAEGYHVHGGRRGGEKLEPLAREIAAAGGRFTGHSLDARDEQSVTAFLDAAEASAPLEAVIFNVGANVQFSLLETTERVFSKVWDMACKAGFLTGREALAQSMARELGPQGLHVAHLVIDAGVDTAWVRERIAQAKGADVVAALPPDTLMDPASIAETYLMLHRQPRDAWTHELDLRPYGENW